MDHDPFAELERYAKAQAKKAEATWFHAAFGDESYAIDTQNHWHELHRQLEALCIAAAISRSVQGTCVKAPSAEHCTPVSIHALLIAQLRDLQAAVAPPRGDHALPTRIAPMEHTEQATEIAAAAAKEVVHETEEDEQEGGCIVM